MLYNRKEIPEVHYLKHLHDDQNNHVNYEDIILKNNLSPYLFKNNMMNEWLIKLQPLVSLLFDKINLMKNFKNFTVDKYEYRHSR
jgi:hypothetical protein